MKVWNFLSQKQKMIWINTFMQVFFPQKFLLDTQKEGLTIMPTISHGNFEIVFLEIRKVDFFFSKTLFWQIVSLDS